MDFNLYKVFVAIVEAGSFSGAATRLDMPNSSVSRHLAQLEKHLGGRLLERTTRKLHLTPAGIALYQRLRPLLKELQACWDETLEQELSLRGDLIITSPIEFGLSELHTIVPAFIAQYPDITIHYELTNREVDLYSEAVDIAFKVSPGPLPDSSMMAYPVRHAKKIVVASPSLLARYAVVQHPSDLLQLPCLLRTGQTHWTFLTDQQPLVIKPAGPLYSNTISAILQSACAGIGVAMLPYWICEDSLKRHELVEILTGYPIEAVQVYALTASPKQRSKRVKAFLDFTRDSIKTRAREQL